MQRLFSLFSLTFGISKEKTKTTKTHQLLKKVKKNGWLLI